MVMVDTTCHTHTHVHMCTCAHITPHLPVSMGCTCECVMHDCSFLAQAFSLKGGHHQAFIPCQKEFVPSNLELLPKGSHLKFVLLLDPLPKGTLSPNPKPRGVEESPLVQRGWLIGVNGMANPGTGITRTGHQELAQ